VSTAVLAAPPSPWLFRALAALVSSSVQMARLIARYQKVVWATTRLELVKRYAGSALGKAWIVLQPTLLLSVYVFVYIAIFKVKLPGMTSLEYVVFVFSGLAPYLGFMEATSSGCYVIRQNLHLVKNVMLPIELVPVRAVMVSMVTQMVSLGVVIFLAALVGKLTVHLFWLPVVLLLQVMMLLGVVWILSGVALVVPDVAQFVNLGLTFLMFISPIGFTLAMVSPMVRTMAYLNPIYYLTEMYRCSLLYGQLPSLTVATVYVVLCVTSFAAGAAFFLRFKDALIDYE
jgi:lipopolysaccharide transport system permease protein